MTAALAPVAPALPAVPAAGLNSLRAVWQAPTEETARQYVQSLLPTVKALRKEPAWKPRPQYIPRPIPPVAIGPYRADCILGTGGNGQALGARHQDTGEAVTIKLLGYGDALVAAWLGEEGQDLPLLRVYGSGLLETPEGPVWWTAREQAAETWADHMARRRGEPVPLDEAVEVFATVCRAVDHLHDRSVFQWSAHGRNLYRVDGRWKLGDMGRSLILTTPDDPRLARVWPEARSADDHVRVMLEEEADPKCTPWGRWAGERTAGWAWHTEERELRLRLDDCAMLGGLLVELIGGHKWETFHRALTKAPYCSGRYRLTGRKDVDERLSTILNRCWRGDAGGAILRANGSRGEQTVYADAVALLADVQDALKTSG